MSLSNEQQFLRALTKLSKKHGLYVGGCGCFGSPFLSDKNGTVVVEDVTYHVNMDKYVGLDKETKESVQ